MAWLRKVMSAKGEWIDPARLNPYRRGRVRPPGPPTESENAGAWMVLKNYFTAAGQSRTVKSRQVGKGG